MGAKFLFAVDAADGKVRRVGKPFRMGMVGDFPFYKQGPRHQNQGDGEGIYHVVPVFLGDDDKHDGGEHHREIPVIDTAGRAATVVHHPGLEGAEEEDADHVGDRIEQRNEHQNALIDDAQEIQGDENRVETYPTGKHQ